MDKPKNQEVKTKKQLFSERLSGKYPDRDFTDEEIMYGQINDDYDSYEKELDGYRQRESDLTGMFSSDPRSAVFLTNWRKGEDPVVQFVRQFGSEIKDAIDDPEKLDAIASANKEYAERVAKEKELEEAYKQNLETSMADLSRMQEERGLTDEQIESAMQFVSTIANDYVMGKITPATMELAFKAMNYDTDVAEASEEGEIKGRNTKIEERLKKEKSGDGMPADMSGRNNSQKKAPKPMGVLDEITGDSIWDRGKKK